MRKRKGTALNFLHRISIIHFGDIALSYPLTDLVPANAEEFAGHLFHPSVTALLGNDTSFENSALILTEALLPVTGSGLGQPLWHTRALPNRTVDLGEVGDINALAAKVWRDAEVQRRLLEMWQEREREVQAQGKVNEFLAGLEEQVRSLTFPSPPAGSVVRTHVGHLRLALRAVVVEYVARGRR